MALEYYIGLYLLQTSVFNYGMVHLTVLGYSFVYNGMAELLA